MLKPKYRTLSAAIVDFNGLLRGLDERHPKDTTIIKPVAPAKPVTESRGAEVKPVPMLEHAPLSKYSSSKSALNSFRVLAGLEERVIMPWDAGVVGTTRHNRDILAEADVAVAASPEPDPEPAAEPEPKQDTTPNHLKYGRKISDSAMLSSKILQREHRKHQTNRHAMPMDAAKAQDQEFAARHESHGRGHAMVAKALHKLSRAALKRGDRRGGVELAHRGKLHSAIAEHHAKRSFHPLVVREWSDKLIRKMVFEAIMDIKDPQCAGWRQMNEDIKAWSKTYIKS